MAEYKSNYTGEQIDAGIAKANTAIQDISGKQDTLVSGTNIKTINSESLLGSGNINISGGISIKEINYADPTQFDDGQPTAAVLNDIATHEYQALKIYNIPINEDMTIEIWYFVTAMLHAENTELRKYFRLDDSNETYGSAMAVMTIQKTSSEDATMSEDEYQIGNGNNQ